VDVLRTPEERFAILSTALGTGDIPLGQGFLGWRAWAKRNPDMDVARLMKRSCPQLADDEAAACTAPFPDAHYTAGVRRFPAPVPDRPDAHGAALSRRRRRLAAD